MTKLHAIYFGTIADGHVLMAAFPTAALAQSYANAIVPQELRNYLRFEEFDANVPATIETDKPVEHVNIASVRELLGEAHELSQAAMLLVELQSFAGHTVFDPKHQSAYSC